MPENHMALNEWFLVSSNTKERLASRRLKVSESLHKSEARIEQLWEGVETIVFSP